MRDPRIHPFTGDTFFMIWIYNNIELEFEFTIMDISRDSILILIDESWLGNIRFLTISHDDFHKWVSICTHLEVATPTN